MRVKDFITKYTDFLTWAMQLWSIGIVTDATKEKQLIKDNYFCLLRVSIEKGGSLEGEPMESFTEIGLIVHSVNQEDNGITIYFHFPKK